MKKVDSITRSCIQHAASFRITSFGVTCANNNQGETGDLHKLNGTINSFLLRVSSFFLAMTLSFGLWLNDKLILCVSQTNSIDNNTLNEV